MFNAVETLLLNPRSPMQNYPAQLRLYVSSPPEPALSTAVFTHLGTAAIRREIHAFSQKWLQVFTII